MPGNEAPVQETARDVLESLVEVPLLGWAFAVACLLASNAEVHPDLLDDFLVERKLVDLAHREPDQQLLQVQALLLGCHGLLALEQTVKKDLAESLRHEAVRQPPVLDCPPSWRTKS